MKELIILLISVLFIISYSFQNVLNKEMRTNKHSLLSMRENKMINKNDMKFNLGRIAFSLLPLSPESVGKRKTIFKEIVKNQIWTLDQIQGIINVNVPVRSTIIKLAEGGLFVNNPVAPTKECIDYIRELEAKHGPVKYITLASLALEHKGTVGAFSSYFSKAEVYVQPGQYSFPINLPTSFFFPFGKTVKQIPTDFRDAPWASEIEHITLGPLKPPGVGGFGDTAFFHKATGTLFVTDSIVKVEDEPPEIIQDDPRALLYHARDTMLEIVKDTPTNRRKGWRRMVLFGLYFQPAGIDVKDTFDAIKMLNEVSPEMRKLGEGAIPYDGGLYPWDWIKSEIPSFKALQGGLLVAPILQTLILNREPEKVITWVNKICQWKFNRIIPCHLSNNIKSNPKEFRKAFNFLYNNNKSKLLPEDIQFLSDTSETLTKQGILFPEKYLN